MLFWDFKKNRSLTILHPTFLLVFNYSPFAAVKNEQASLHFQLILLGDVEWPNLQLYELKAVLVMGEQMSGEIELY